MADSVATRLLIEDLADESVKFEALYLETYASMLAYRQMWQQAMTGWVEDQQKLLTAREIIRTIQGHMATLMNGGPDDQ